MANAEMCFRVTEFGVGLNNAQRSEIDELRTLLKARWGGPIPVGEGIATDQLDEIFQEATPGLVADFQTRSDETGGDVKWKACCPVPTWDDGKVWRSEKVGLIFELRVESDGAAGFSRDDAVVTFGFRVI